MLATPKESTVNHDALSTYLNDHLAGATLGCDHARQLEKMSAETPFGPAMTRIASEIEQDRDALVDLMDRLGVSRNPVKQAGAWVAEKAGRFKLSGVTSGDADLGRYLMLESMSLGVEGKRSLWTALLALSSQHSDLQATDLVSLIARAEAQRDALETERLQTVGPALAAAGASRSW